jgi:hypothetical protein
MVKVTSRYRLLPVGNGRINICTLYLIMLNIMRTTIDIDDPILREIKAIQEREGRSLGAIVSELLAEALAGRHSSRVKPSFRWASRPMKALIDLADKDKVHAILDAGRAAR